MDVQETARIAEQITGDAAIGDPTSIAYDEDTAAVRFQGSLGWYDVMTPPGAGMIIVFTSGSRSPQVCAREPSGIYYTEPRDDDGQVATLLSGMLEDLPQLGFIAGYITGEPSGVSWRRFDCQGAPLVFKTRADGDETDIEVTLGGQTIAMRQDASGAISGVRDDAEARL